MSGDCVVLAYHAVSERWPWAFSITPERLERQVRWFLRRGFSAVTFAEASRRPSQRTLAITFDDGFRSVNELAFPLLERLRVPATVFVVADHAESGAPLAWPPLDEWLETEHRRELEPATWEELRGLADAGWEVGSHTCTHAVLDTLGPEDLERELRRSRQRCEAALGRPCLTLAYPFGAYDARVAAAARAAGYVAAAAFPPRGDPRDDFGWPRVAVRQDEAELAFRLKCSRLYRTLRPTRAFRALAALRL